jgi:hypothetical protein
LYSSRQASASKREPDAGNPTGIRLMKVGLGTMKCVATEIYDSGIVNMPFFEIKEGVLTAVSIVCDTLIIGSPPDSASSIKKYPTIIAAPLTESVSKLADADSTLDILTAIIEQSLAYEARLENDSKTGTNDIQGSMDDHSLASIIPATATVTLSASTIESAAGLPVQNEQSDNERSFAQTRLQRPSESNLNATASLMKENETKSTSWIIHTSPITEGMKESMYHELACSLATTNRQQSAI